MLFNSIEYLIFLPIVFLLYWFVFDYALKQCKYQLFLQNCFLLAASYLFYGWWSWRFLLLIAFTTLCSYLSGLGITKARMKYQKQLLLWANILVNLAILGIFKYYDFFVTSFADLFHVDATHHLLHLVLPVGISFYTFQALSYSIDVYKEKIEPTKNFVAFAAFISFFPQLVAGPIERATNLLPQFLRRRNFDYSYAVDGMRLILWGLFKKMVVADNCAIYVDTIFEDPSQYSASSLVLAAVLFTFQIYGDFSGYSDIAIGTAKLFGIRLMRNFNVPYFSRDIAEFWRRWHISLTTWFRDYIYIPLGGSRPEIPDRIKHKEAYKKAVIVRNTFIIFLMSGLWHGANWTFILWGVYHAVLFLPLILLGKNRKYMDTSTWRDIPKILLTFVLAVIGWIIFRADNIGEAWNYVTQMCSSSLVSVPYLINRIWYVPMFVSLSILLIVEWIGRDNGGILLSIQMPKCRILRWGLYLLLIAYIYFFGNFSYTQFIYFQF